MGVQEVYSASRGFWYFGHPADNVTRAVYVGGDAATLSEHFASVQLMSTIGTELPVDTLYEDTPVWLVEYPREPWSQIWPKLRDMRLHI